ncbi:helix-turn-helix transcriptional regulator [Paenarthrobacter sp. CAP02]|uniref:helix-turn-helix domain-containing protein n=1 Tax=Paenarthrobacter sp. CAP02 TaxID=3158144 RepID=UPI0032DBA910
MSKISDIDHERIAHLVRLGMSVKRLKVAPLAKHIGVDQTTLTNYRTGYRPIPADRIDRLAEALELDPRLLDAQAA